MSATITPQDDPQTILEKAKPRGPKKCHTLDHRDYALCGAFGPCTDGDGNQIPNPTRHSEKKCKAQGHKKCVACKELDRQLGDDGMVA